LKLILATLDSVFTEIPWTIFILWNGHFSLKLHFYVEKFEGKNNFVRTEAKLLKLPKELTKTDFISKYQIEN